MLLRCEVHPGMFTDERVVTVDRADGQAESFFVPRVAVLEERSCIQARVLGRVDGPCPTFLASILTAEGKALVTVKESDIQSR